MDWLISMAAFSPFALLLGRHILTATDAVVFLAQNDTVDVVTVNVTPATHMRPIVLVVDFAGHIYSVNLISPLSARSKARWARASAGVASHSSSFGSSSLEKPKNTA